MQQARFYPQQQQRSASTARPGPAAIIPPQSLSAQQQHQQHQLELAAQGKKREEAKNRAAKPTDRDLPVGLDDLVIGDGVEHYTRLRDVERRLDATMMRKRLDIQDPVYRGPKRYGTMRIWISNTVKDQPWQDSELDPSEAFDFNSGVEASYRVKIEGRLLDSADEDADQPDHTEPTETEEIDEDGQRAAKRTKLSPAESPRKKFSRYFKSITIDLDRPRSLQADNWTRIEWIRPDSHVAQGQLDPPKEADFDCLEFQRKGDENINVTIKLVRDERPERYKLSQGLAELLDMEEADRLTLMMGMWEYIRSAGLHGEEDQRRVVCDAKLREILGVEMFSFAQLPDILRRHLTDIPPVVLPYTIRVDRAYHAGDKPPAPTIYDVMVPLEDPLQGHLRALASSPNYMPTLQNITAKDDELALQIQAMYHAKAKHSFFTAMSKDPANFLKRWISSQKRDLDVILGASSWGEEDFRNPEWRLGGTGGPWGTSEVVEGVGSFLTRQQPQMKAQ